MNDLVCKNDDCNTVVTCDEEATAVTCSYCCATLGMCSSDDQYLNNYCGCRMV